MTTTSGTVSYTLSSTVVRVKGIYVTSGGVQYQPLEPISLERMLELRQGSPASSQGGSLRYYTLVGLSQFELYPTPTGSETLTIYYVRQPTALSANGDIPEIPEPFASKLIEYGALAEAADFKRETDFLQNYQQRYLEWIGKFRAHLGRKRGGVPEQMLIYGTPGYTPHDPSTDIGY